MDIMQFSKLKGASQYDKTSYGVTFGGNIEIMSNSGNKLSIGLFISIRSKEFRDHYDAVKDNPRIEMKNNLSPVGISIGYNFLL